MSDPELERVYQRMLARIKPRAAGPPPLRHPCPHGARKSHCEECLKLKRRPRKPAVKCPHGLTKHQCRPCMQAYDRRYYLEVRLKRIREVLDKVLAEC